MIPIFRAHLVFKAAPAASGRDEEEEEEEEEPMIVVEGGLNTDSSLGFPSYEG